MELAQSILTGILYIVFYVFSTLFIFQFILGISVAFEKHCKSSATSHTIVTTETVAEKSKLQTYKSDNNQGVICKPPTVKQLRKRCSQAGIKWSYAIQEPKLCKKRHLNREEMLIALTQIKHAA